MVKELPAYLLIIRLVGQSVGGSFGWSVSGHTDRTTSRCEHRSSMMARRSPGNGANGGNGGGQRRPQEEDDVRVVVIIDFDAFFAQVHRPAQSSLAHPRHLDHPTTHGHATSSHATQSTPLHPHPPTHSAAGALPA